MVPRENSEITVAGSIMPPERSIGDDFDLADPVMIIDRSGTVLDYNEALSRHIGIPPDSDTDLSTILSALDLAPETRREIHGVIHRWNGPPDSPVFETYRHVNGTTVTLKWLARKHGENEFGETLLLVRGRDITRRVMLEKENHLLRRRLMLQDRLLKAFMEHSGSEAFTQAHALILEETDSRDGLIGYIDTKGDCVCPAVSGGATPGRGGRAGP